MDINPENFEIDEEWLRNTALLWGVSSETCDLIIQYSKQLDIDLATFMRSAVHQFLRELAKKLGEPQE